MPKINPNRNITRAESFDDAGNRTAGGWMVRFTRKGKTKQSYFGDAKHGGKKGSLEAARKNRDEVEAKVEPATPYRRVVGKTANNTSGVVGVRWSEKTVKKGKKKYVFEFATASWTTEAGSSHRSTAAFSVKKYGKKKAWEMAKAARAKGVAAYKKTIPA